jgi:hypothetical protein
MVWWMWWAGLVVVVGTVVALWPSRQQAAAYASTALAGARAQP